MVCIVLSATGSDNNVHRLCCHARRGAPERAWRACPCARTSAEEQNTRRQGIGGAPQPLEFECRGAIGGRNSGTLLRDCWLANCTTAPQEPASSQAEIVDYCALPFEALAPLPALSAPFELARFRVHSPVPLVHYVPEFVSAHDEQDMSESEQDEQEEEEEEEYTSQSSQSDYDSQEEQQEQVVEEEALHERTFDTHGLTAAQIRHASPPFSLLLGA